MRVGDLVKVSSNVPSGWTKEYWSYIAGGSFRLLEIDSYSGMVMIDTTNTPVLVDTIWIPVGYFSHVGKRSFFPDAEEGNAAMARQSQIRDEMLSKVFGPESRDLEDEDVAKPLPDWKIVF